MESRPLLRPEPAATPGSGARPGPSINAPARYDGGAQDGALLADGDAGVEGGGGGGGGGATAWQTGLNMLNELEGAGLLGLPYALKLGGWLSLGCLALVGCMAGLTGWLLAMCMCVG